MLHGPCRSISAHHIRPSLAFVTVHTLSHRGRRPTSVDEQRLAHTDECHLWSLAQNMVSQMRSGLKRDSQIQHRVAYGLEKSDEGEPFHVWEDLVKTITGQFESLSLSAKVAHPVRCWDADEKVACDIR